MIAALTANQQSPRRSRRTATQEQELLRLYASQQAEQCTIRVRLDDGERRRLVVGERVEPERVPFLGIRGTSPRSRRRSLNHCAACERDLIGDRYRQNPISGALLKYRSWCVPCYERLCAWRMRSRNRLSSKIRSYDPHAIEIIDQRALADGSRLERVTAEAQGDHRCKSDQAPASGIPFGSIGFNPPDPVLAYLAHRISPAELAWRKMIEKATPDQRAWLHAMAPHCASDSQRMDLAFAIELIRERASAEHLQQLRDDPMLKERVLHRIIDTLRGPVGR